MDKRFWAIIGVVVLVFIGVVAFTRKDASAPASNAANVQPTDHVKGGDTKHVTLVEYGDFQCPVCGLYEPTVEQVYKKYQNDIKLQFRNFPLQQMHQNAFAAARAAEAAGMQGKFWQMHDMLYANQNAWSDAPTPQTYFQQYAKSIGLNLDQFNKDFSSDKVNALINADIAAGNKLNVSGTPTFYLNGKEIPLQDIVGSNNQPSVDKFSAQIDNAIKAAQKQ